MKRKLAVAKRPLLPARLGAKGLLRDVREMILSARQTVAQGVTTLLPRKQLEKKLHETVRLARQRLQADSTRKDRLQGHR